MIPMQWRGCDPGWGDTSKYNPGLPNTSEEFLSSPKARTMGAVSGGRRMSQDHQLVKKDHQLVKKDHQLVKTPV